MNGGTFGSSSQQGEEGWTPTPTRYQLLTDVNPAAAVHVECESGASGTTTSAVGPGLDSDFGASAGTCPPCVETLAAGRPERAACVLRRFPADPVI